MCDFAVVAHRRKVAHLAAIELKSGAADPEDIEQLKEGLDLLHSYFDYDGPEPRLVAYFVVGKEADRLGFALRDRLSTLRFGSRPVKLEIRICGESVHL